MAVDLHTHSTASDGSATPTELVEKAVEIGLSALALTDHDTQEGVPEARSAAAGADLELIAGAELSLDYDAGAMHLLVLWLEPGPGPLQDRLAELREGRDERNERIVQALSGLGMPMSMTEIREEAGGGAVGRPHIAAVMVKKGYATDITAAFDEWLARGRPGYMSRPRLTQEEGVGLARESGAVPILSHPHTLGVVDADEMARTLHRLKAAGLVGLEAACAPYRRHERDGYTHLARRFGLVPTGGSDFHGAYKPGLELGVGYGDLAVPDSVVDELRERAVSP